MIFIKNVKIFNCEISRPYHWSKLKKLNNLMKYEYFNFPADADLSGADLRGADLSDADLRGADLRGADLLGADLLGADLRGADLRGADLSDADLRGADLSDADLSGVYLSGADHEKLIIKDFISVTRFGRYNRTTFIYKTDKGIYIQCGCFFGNEDNFKKQVKETHKNTHFAKEYIEMLKLAKLRFSREEV